MIKFNVPFVSGLEEKYVNKVIRSNNFCGDGLFTKKCSELLEKRTLSKKVLLTTSCTHALEMAAILANIKSGDEVIMPSFTFVSTANAFVLRGAKIVFVDIRPDTMNIDENKIEDAISTRTKAIVPVHYAGVACEMDRIMAIASKYNLIVIEDAAQGIDSTYKGRALGSIGHLGTISFHETKNINCGEGGALLINDDKYIERAEIIREKGTDRSKFLRGQIDKYSWVDVGSSYLPSELNAAFLYAQLENVSLSTQHRLQLWNKYFESFQNLYQNGAVELQIVPSSCLHNGHMFYIKLSDINQRQSLISYLKENGVQSVFHYIPLHSSIEGRKVTSFNGEDQFTTTESERILRLPMHFDLKMEDVDFVVSLVNSYFFEK